MPPYEDDATLDNDEVLWRRVPNQWVKFDDNLNYFRPSSQAFQDSRDGTPMSVFIAAECGGVEDALAEHDAFLLVSFSVGEVRELGLGVTRDPKPGAPAHALVFGKKTGSVRSSLAKGCEWVVGPEDIE